MSEEEKKKNSNKNLAGISTNFCEISLKIWGEKQGELACLEVHTSVLHGFGLYFLVCLYQTHPFFFLCSALRQSLLGTGVSQTNT